MNKNPGDTINTGSLALLVFLAVVEIELYTASAELVKIAGRDAWLAVLIGGLGSYVTLYFLVRLGQKFRSQTFFEYSPRLWGYIFTRVIILVFLVYWIVWLVRLLWRMADINTTFFLPNTPIIVILLLFTVGTTFLASYGLVPIVRFFEFSLLFFFIPYLFTIIVALSQIKIMYMTPVFAQGVEPVFKSAFHYMTKLQGLEIVLFALPFTKNPQNALKPALAGLTLINVSAFIQVLAVLGNIGAISTQDLVYPSAVMLSSLHLPGWPVERFEPFLTLPWLIGVFSTIALMIYLTTYGSTLLFNIRRPKFIYWAVGLGVIPLTYFLPNILWSYEIDKVLSILPILTIYIFPLTAYILAVINGKRKERN